MVAVDSDGLHSTAIVLQVRFRCISYVSYANVQGEFCKPFLYTFAEAFVSKDVE